MHSFIIVSQTKEEQEIKIHKILAPYKIDPIDIIRVTSETTISIAQIRELKQKIGLKPYKSPAKAVIIENAHTTTTEAQNALLKTLEEPPPNTIIILATDTLNQFLPTIVSRCQIIEVFETKPIVLTKREQTILQEQMDILLGGSIGEKLALAQQEGKTKEEALQWTNMILLVIHSGFIEDIHSKINKTKQIQLVRSLLSLSMFLQTTNSNPRMVLENAFLSI